MPGGRALHAALPGVPAPRPLPREPRGGLTIPPAPCPEAPEGGMVPHGLGPPDDDLELQASETDRIELTARGTPRFTARAIHGSPGLAQRLPIQHGDR